MKKIGALILTFCLLLSVGSIALTANAAEATDVFVTVVTVENGAARIAWAGNVSLSGDATVEDALCQAHELGYTGGAAGGFATSDTQYGKSLDKLWGVANGGSYGYCVNDTFANSLADTVQNGDRVTAYVYEMGVCDTYAYFDGIKKEGRVGESVELTLFALTYDPVTWAPTAAPVSGARLTVDGEDTSVYTDADGKATLSLSRFGEYTISAKKEGVGLVSPICILQVFPSVDTNLPELTLPDDGATQPTAEQKTDGCGSTVSGAGLVLSLLAAAFVMGNRRREDR